MLGVLGVIQHQPDQRFVFAVVKRERHGFVDRNDLRVAQRDGKHGPDFVKGGLKPGADGAPFGISGFDRDAGFAAFGSRFSPVWSVIASPSTSTVRTCRGEVSSPHSPALAVKESTRIIGTRSFPLLKRMSSPEPFTSGRGNAETCRLPSVTLLLKRSSSALTAVSRTCGVIRLSREAMTLPFLSTILADKPISATGPAPTGMRGC